MRRTMYIGLLVGTGLFYGFIKADELKRHASPDSTVVTFEYIGDPTNGLKPIVVFEKSPGDWSVEINFTAQTNFPEYQWLKVTNRVGSKLQLWSTNGVEIVSTNSEVLTAMSLPFETTVQDVMRGVFRERRGMQWLFTQQGRSVTAANFGLRKGFDVCLTNDLVLQVVPLIYRVETNQETAHLFEFPAIRIKLLVDGTVQKLEE